MKRLFARAVDVLCFVVGPVLLVRGAFVYLGYDHSERRFYAADTLNWIAVGIALIAFGLLRMFWTRKRSE